MYRLIGPKIDLELTEPEARRLLSAAMAELTRKQRDRRDLGLYPTETSLVSKINHARATGLEPL